ncbi:MAG: sulfite exporter TauE/SafE family protein [Alphaproteobacteria bacterium]|nr:sulfite exporter TauE/SafE family protein [Alphaproteobacteria bacterium]
MTLGSIAFGFLAGVLSVLSPCVLPILPLVFGSAITAHRFGAVALAAGLVLSFVTVGLFVATVGFAIGLDGDVFRTVSALLLAAIGAVLLLDALKQRFAVAVSGLGNSGNRLLRRLSPVGLLGQFTVGLVLGAVWSPCVGPTLGAASILASQGRDLGSVAAVMAAFGAGTAIVLLAIGALSREALRRWQRRVAGAGNFGTHLLGGAALAVAVLILTGADRSIEAALVNASPGWLTGLTTRF